MHQSQSLIFGSGRTFCGLGRVL